MDQSNKTLACPVMGFMVDQATRETPVVLVGKSGFLHLSPFNLPEPVDQLAAQYEWQETIPAYTQIAAHHVSQR